MAENNQNKHTATVVYESPRPVNIGDVFYRVEYGEVVFCNPPYGRDIGKWVAKAHAETLAGGGHARCYAHTRPHGHGVFSRLHIQKARGTVYPRAVALQRKQKRRPFPVNGGCYAIGRYDGRRRV